MHGHRFKENQRPGTKSPLSSSSVDTLSHQCDEPLREGICLSQTVEVNGMESSSDGCGSPVLCQYQDVCDVEPRSITEATNSSETSRRRCVNAELEKYSPRARWRGHDTWHTSCSMSSNSEVGLEVRVASDCSDDVVMEDGNSCHHSFTQENQSPILKKRGGCQANYDFLSLTDGETAMEQTFVPGTVFKVFWDTPGPQYRLHSASVCKDSVTSPRQFRPRIQGRQLQDHKRWRQLGGLPHVKGSGRGKAQKETVQNLCLGRATNRQARRGGIHKLQHPISGRNLHNVENVQRATKHEPANKDTLNKRSFTKADNDAKPWGETGNFTLPDGHPLQAERAELLQRLHEAFESWTKELRSSISQVHFKCPFYLFDSKVFQRCLLEGSLASIDNLMHHLKAHHTEAPICPVCGRSFQTNVARDQHYARNTCELTEETGNYHGYISAYRMDEISNMGDHEKRATECYANIWNAIFPGTNLSGSPLLSPEVGSQISMLRDFWSAKGKEQIDAYLKSRNLNQVCRMDEDNAIQTLTRSIMGDMLSMVIGV